MFNKIALPTEFAPTIGSDTGKWQKVTVYSPPVSDTDVSGNKVEIVGSIHTCNRGSFQVSRVCNLPYLPSGSGKSYLFPDLRYIIPELFSVCQMLKVYGQTAIPF